MDYFWLSRDIVNWEYYKNGYTFLLYMHLVVTVSDKDTNYRGFFIKKWERVVSYEMLSKEMNISIQNVRTALKHLLSCKAITKRQEGKYTIIGINDYVEDDNGALIIETPPETIYTKSTSSYKADAICGVYRYIYKDEVIYVGKSDSNIGSRIKAHSKEDRFQPFLGECEISYAKLANPALTTIYETYLINKYKPKLNMAMKYDDEISFELPELDWQKLE